MLSRKNRIQKNEFPSYKNKGIRFLSTYFTGNAYLRAGDARFCVVVAKKTAKDAVTRNRLRRRFYAAAGPYVKSLSGKASIVFYPKMEALRAPLPKLQEEFDIAFQKIKIL